MIKKSLSLLIIFVLMLSLAACGKSENSSNNSASDSADGEWLTFSNEDSTENSELVSNNSNSKEDDSSSYDSQATDKNGTVSSESKPQNNKNETENSKVTDSSPSSKDNTSSEKPKEEVTKKNLKIVYFGDSVTFRGDVNKSYATYASQTINNENERFSVTVVNKGVPGNTVSDLYARLEKDVISENPDIVSILVGVNDTATYQKNVSDDEFKTIYKNIINTIKTKLPNTDIVLMTPFIFKKNGSYSIDVLQGRISVVKELANQFGLTLVDTNALIIAKQDSGNINSYADDGVHPNANGAKLIAEEWIKGTKNIFK